MKKTLLMLLAIIAAFHFTGCKKVLDQIHHNPGQEFPFCDIKKFKVWHGDTYNEFTVTYNNKGQPKDILGLYPDSPLHNYSFNQHFRYDNKGRLTDWITNPPGQQHVWVWNTFHYLSPTRIVDSLYYGWSVQSYITDMLPPYNSDVKLVRFLDFDSYGRIVKVSAPLPDTTIVINYVYDSNGNSNAHAAYDSGVNIMRTNKIWMLTNYNYSTNNYTLGLNGGPRYKYTYNSYMLPITIETSNGSDFIFMTDESVDACFFASKLAIEYDCNGAPKYYY